MAGHVTAIRRSGEGVIGVCTTCGDRQKDPQPDRARAEDWVMMHETQVRLAQADPGARLTDRKYLEYLQERAADPNEPPRQRELWRALAEEHGKRMRAGAAGPRGDRPQSTNAKYNTGVETEPLW